MNALSALALAATLVASRPFADERLLLDRRLETLRRLLPDGPQQAADQALLREAAQQAGLGAFDVRARPPQDAGQRGENTCELSAAGRFTEVERFFRQLALAHRLPDVEALTLSGTPDLVRLTAVVRLPYRPLGAPLPPPPDTARTRLGGVPRPQAEAFLRDQALVLAKAEVVAAWRRVRRSPRLFLSELGALAREQPVVLTYAELRPAAQADYEFVVRGLAAGDGPARALETRLERGFLRLGEFLMARQAACVRFEARGRSPVAGSEAALPLPADDPFVPDAAPCRVDRDSGRTLVARAGSESKGKAPAGSLVLRLRDTDLADVFGALHALTGEGFLVDGDVSGRTSVDFQRVSLAEALDALQRAAGLRVAGGGVLRRVAFERRAPWLPPPPSAGGASVSYALKRASVRDLLAVMSEADPQYAALGPSGLLGRLSLWVRQAPLADVRAWVLAAAGLGERLEEGRRIVTREGSEEPPLPVAATSGEPRLELASRELSVVEFDLAGVGSDGSQWLAFVYAPGGALLSYRAGDPLADGKVREIQSTDVVLDTDDGPQRVLVPPLR